ncbi:MAG TPA: hypothetical protein VIZ44_12895 [Gaiellaceae bacterium]|jgi:hypothetical protein
MHGYIGARSLPDDIRRTLVVPQTEETWLPQPALTRPLGEPDLGHELWPRPVGAPRDRPRVRERRLGRLQLAQPSTELPERLRAVAGGDLPRVPEPVRLVVADEQGAEVGPAAGGVGVAAITNSCSRTHFSFSQSLERPRA